MKRMKKWKEKIYDFEVLFDPNGSGYTVTVSNLPGLVTEGSTIKEAREMAKDAIRCHVGSLLRAVSPHSSKPAKSQKVKLAV
jgi:predicted RNase H-like HicB family nuclease